MTVPFTLEIDIDSGVAVGSFTGTIDPATGRDALVALWSDPRWSGRAVVWDLRDACLAVSPDEVRAMAGFILNRQPAPPPSRIAFVTDDDLDYGTMRMLEAYREDPRTETRVLRDFGAALDWAIDGGTAG